MEGEYQQGNPGREGAEDKEDSIDHERHSQSLAPVARLEVGIEAETDSDEYDFYTNTIRNADIGSITEEGEETPYQSEESVEFVEAPIISSTHDPSVDEGWSKDNEETEEEKVGRFFETARSSVTHHWEEYNEGTEEKEECVGEFEVVVEERLFSEVGQGVFDGQANEDEGDKGCGERTDGQWGILDSLDESSEECFHRTILAY